MCKGLASLPTCCLERAKVLKARLGSILQKPNWNLSGCKKRQNKPTLEECLRWKQSFEKLLSSKYGLCAFTSFLVSEFSEENIAFYFACEDYRCTKSPSKIPAKAQKIFDEFISSDAPREVRHQQSHRQPRVGLTPSTNAVSLRRPLCRLTSIMKLVTSPKPTCWSRRRPASIWLSTRSTCSWLKTATPASSAPQPTGPWWSKPNPWPRPPISPRRRRCEMCLLTGGEPLAAT
ncbi:regulator of G-protein signaling 5-like isoform X1 [Antennarius striatus]|uniref:regulator of G-protein signaling 5-like isoform X1 n=1 Tax=Antennarius striatus TaxID=241820 RepID=UPI0035AF91D5